MPLETRVIERYGLFRFPEEVQESKQVVLNCDLLRVPGNRSQNYTSNPANGFLGYITLMREGRVVERLKIEYSYQTFTLFDSSVGYQLDALLCVQRSLSFNLLLVYNNLKEPLDPVITFTESERFTRPRWGVDELKVRLFNNAVVRLSLLWVDVEPPCDLSALEEPFDPLPEPQDIPEEYPTPGDDGDDPLPSLPYDEATEDNGETYVPPRDDKSYTITCYGVFCPGGPNPSNSCTIYNVNGQDVLFTRTITSYGMPYVETGTTHNDCPECSTNALRYRPSLASGFIRLQDLTGGPWAHPGSITITEN